jgi:hypothetical protein
MESMLFTLFLVLIVIILIVIVFNFAIKQRDKELIQKQTILDVRH